MRDTSAMSKCLVDVLYMFEMHFEIEYFRQISGALRIWAALFNRGTDNATSFSS